MDNFNTGINDEFIPLNHLLYYLPKDSNNLTNVYTSNKKSFRKIFFDLEDNLFFTEINTLPELVEYSEKIDERYKKYDIEKNIITSCSYDNFYPHENISNIFIGKNNKIYYEYSNATKIFIIEYDIISKKEKEIFSIESKNSYINNFWLLNKISEG